MSMQAWVCVCTCVLYALASTVMSRLQMGLLSCGLAPSVRAELTMQVCVCAGVGGPCRWVCAGGVGPCR